MPNKGGKGFSPSLKPARVTATELGDFFDVFKKITENKWVIPSVIAAGIGAALETIHILWLFVKFLCQFSRG